MQPQRPVYWYSGQFLEPQHFQQADAFHASERASLLQSAQPCFWGVGSLDVDEAALAEGRILVRSGIMRFSGWHRGCNRRRAGRRQPPSCQAGVSAKHGRTHICRLRCLPASRR